MAGHSQFKNIMHRKGAQDKRRAKIFSKISREIIVAAKTGIPDPETNPRLRAAIQAARAANMPGDRIKRAIESGSPGGDDSNYEEVRYEGYGSGGVAVIVDALTDNRNRTAAEVRAAFTKTGGNLGETNSVSFMFDRVGELFYPQSVSGFDEMFEAAAEAGAENVEPVDESYEVITGVEDFSTVRDALEARFGEPERGGLAWRPNVTAPLDDEQAEKVLRLIETLEDNDDVQTVTTNMELSEEMMRKLAGED